MANFDNIYSKIKKYSEMTKSESEFLYNEIKKNQPKKILEVGVSSGSSSLLILNAIKDNASAKLYSIDLSESYYKDKSQKVGFLVDKYMQKNDNYKLFSGGTVADFIEEIGYDIDFVLLDAAHGLPGEILDFLLTIPYCKDNVEFVVHDVNIQLYRKTLSNAPAILINTLNADKFYPSTTEYTYNLPNIVALKNFKNLNCKDLFNTLLLNWISPIPKDKLPQIEKILKKHYNKELLNIFKIAVDNNYDFLQTKKGKSRCNKDIKTTKSRWLEQIFSVKNENFNKVIRIFGIKISIKNNKKLLLDIQKNINIQNNQITKINELLKCISSTFGIEHSKKTTFNIKNINSLLACIKTCEYVTQKMNTVSEFNNSNDLLQYAVSNSILEGLNLEFGVYSGRTLNHMSSLFPEKKFYGFDSFVGLPEDWRTGYKKGSFYVNNLPKMNNNVTLVQGWFDKTLPEFVANKNEVCSFIHIDCDLYSSTKTIFANLKPKIKKDTIIVFDEYFNYAGFEEHEFKAFREFVSENKVEYEYIGYVPSSQQVAVKIKSIG